MATLSFYIKIKKFQHTKNEGIQAFVWQIFVNQQFLISPNAATKKSDEISVLQFGNQDYFISEFLCTLPRTLTEPFDCNFFLLT
jgi:hypothetical protein